MRARELMRTEPVTFHEGDPIDEVLDVLVDQHIHGAPVVDGGGRLVGVISQVDIHFGKMTRDDGRPADDGQSGEPLTARDVMTAPPVSATEDTDLIDLCRMMCRLRIHRVPIVRAGKVAGIVSALDVCHAIASGKLSISR